MADVLFILLFSSTMVLVLYCAIKMIHILSEEILI